MITKKRIKARLTFKMKSIQFISVSLFRSSRHVLRRQKISLVLRRIEFLHHHSHAF